MNPSRGKWKLNPLVMAPPNCLAIARLVMRRGFEGVRGALPYVLVNGSDHNGDLSPDCNKRHFAQKSAEREARPNSRRFLLEIDPAIKAPTPNAGKTPVMGVTSGI